MKRPKLLFLTHLMPWPLEGGGQIKSYHVLQGLSVAYDITMLTFIRRPEERQFLTHLEPFCVGGVEPIVLPRTKTSNAVAAVMSLWQNQSFIIRRDDAPVMRRRVQEKLETGGYAVLYIDHLQMAQFVPAETGQTYVVLDNQNIEYRIPQRIAEGHEGGNLKARLMAWYAGREWPKLRDFEAAAVRRADLTITVSDEDAQGMVELAPERVRDIFVVPIGVDTDYFAVANRNPHSKTLLSIGTMYWPPNVDSMLYFCRDIYPEISAKVSGVKLNIVGAKPVPEIVALGEADPTVTVTGRVPDVRPYAEDCGVFVVPLRSGSGMRVKILNALSMGLPVVSTTIGAEGIQVTHGKDILLAGTPAAFAEAVVALLGDPERATALGQAGRALIEAHYSYQAVGRQLRDILQKKFKDVSENGNNSFGKVAEE